MICSYPLVTKEPRPIGFMINDFYYIESEQDIKKIHSSFQLMYHFKQNSRIPETQRSGGSRSNRSGFISQRSLSKSER